MGQSRDTFSWVDYIVFGSVLMISTCIGVYQARSGGKQRTQGEYFMANRQLSPVPVALSLCATFVSAILILGASAEVYSNGIMHWLFWVGIVLASALSVIIFVPLLYPLKITSSNEYIERRFQSRAPRIVSTMFTLLSSIIYMGFAIYSPATALEAVTGFPVWGSVLCVGVVGTFYTALGGMKGVIWTDVFQIVVMGGGLIAVLVVGTNETGGIAKVWEINQKWDRTDLFNFDPNPTVRHTFWTIIFGTAVSWTALYGVNQASVQRYCSLPTMRDAKLAVMLNSIGVFVLTSITCLVGMVVFAYFVEQGCDPLSNGDISNPNQLLPYFMMRVLAYPGLPGLFVATLFAGALSSMSSSLNAMAAVTWEDLLKPIYDSLSEYKKTVITKLLVVVYGIAGCSMSLVAQNMGGTVFQASLSFTLSSMSPIVGMFLLGGCFPRANWVGAVVGSVAGLAVPMWISIGAYVIDLPSAALNVPVENCTNYTSYTPPLDFDKSGVDLVYTISYLWYPATGVVTTIIVGLLVSLMTSSFINIDIDQKYLLPKLGRCCCTGKLGHKGDCCGYKNQNAISAVKQETNNKKHELELDAGSDYPQMSSHL